jgi:hypothetical protein
MAIYQKLKEKKVFKDPGFWLLIGINVYLIYHYFQSPQLFTTLIWLYWSQSVMMGLFNCLDIITVRAATAAPGSKEQPGLAGTRVGVAIFFAAHYGVFHFVYSMFLVTMKPQYPIDWALFRYFLIAFFVGQVITFVQHKVQQRKNGSSIGAMFFLPYLRILPMHFTILIPAFFHNAPLGVFLVLKCIADVAMYIATKPNPSTKASTETLLAAQQPMNM